MNNNIQIKKIVHTILRSSILLGGPRRLFNIKTHTSINTPNSLCCRGLSNKKNLLLPIRLALVIKVWCNFYTYIENIY